MGKKISDTIVTGPAAGVLYTRAQRNFNTLSVRGTKSLGQPAAGGKVLP